MKIKRELHSTQAMITQKWDIETILPVRAMVHALKRSLHGTCMRTNTYMRFADVTPQRPLIS